VNLGEDARIKVGFVASRAEPAVEIKTERRDNRFQEYIHYGPAKQGYESSSELIEETASELKRMCFVIRGSGEAPHTTQLVIKRVLYSPDGA